MSPTRMRSLRFERKSRSPLWKAGAIDSEMTHTMGVDDAVRTDSPFHSISGVVNVDRRDRICTKFGRSLPFPYRMAVTGLDIDVLVQRCE